MSEADDLFAEAYRLSVVEEKHREAVEICRHALTVDPNNYRIRVYLGMLLSDYGTAEEKEESRMHFVEAIKLAKDEVEICDTWFEESALHHLAIWEWNHECHLNACLLFLGDFLTCHSEESYKLLIKMLDELAPKTSAEMKLVLTKIGPSTGKDRQSLT